VVRRSQGLITYIDPYEEVLANHQIVLCATYRARFSKINKFFLSTEKPHHTCGFFNSPLLTMYTVL